MEDPKVVGLDGKAVTPDPEYNTDVISLLETALADAKKLKAYGVSITLIYTPGDDDKKFDIDVYWHGGRLLLLSAAARLSHRLNIKCDEAMEVIT